jgi:hypothetical protein
MYSICCLCTLVSLGSLDRVSLIQNELISNPLGDSRNKFRGGTVYVMFLSIWAQRHKTNKTRRRSLLSINNNNQIECSDNESRIYLTTRNGNVQQSLAMATQNALSAMNVENKELNLLDGIEIVGEHQRNNGHQLH